MHFYYRMKQKLLYTFIFLFFLFFASIASAQRILSLDSAMQIALNKNLNIQVYKQGVLYATNLNNIGVAGGLPTISAQVTNLSAIYSIRQNIAGTNARAPESFIQPFAPYNQLAAQVGANWLLYNGYRVKAVKGQLNELQKISQSQLVAKIQNVLAVVSTLYYNIVSQEELLQAYYINLATNETRLSIVQTKYDVGLANDADLFQSEIDVKNSAQVIEGQRLVIAQAKSILLNALDLDPKDTSLIIQDTTIAIDSTIQLNMVIDSIQNNYSLIAANQNIQLNKYLKSIARAQRYPSLSASGGVSITNINNPSTLTPLNQNYGPFIGINLSIPIYQGSALRRQEKAAMINVVTSELLKDTLYNNLITTSVNSYNVYRNNLSRINDQASIFSLSEKLVAIVLKKYQLSEATILDIKSAQQSFIDAAAVLTNLQFNAKAAEIQLKQLTNSIAL